LVLAACTSSGTYAEQGHFPLADSESALNYEQPDWDEPFWAKFIPDEQNKNKSQAAVRKASVPPAPGQPLRAKLGVIIPQDQGNTASHLVQALQQHASAYDVMVLGPDMLASVIAKLPPCSEGITKQCLQTLAIYPGIRGLLVLDVQNTTGGSTTIR